MVAPDPAPPKRPRLLPTIREAVAGRRTPVRAETGPEEDPGLSPLALSLRRVWARRELYTLAIPQARLDLSLSPLSPGGEIYRSVPVAGPAMVPTYEGGAFVVGPPGPGTTENGTTETGPTETYFRFFALQPFATVEADLVVEGSPDAAGMIEWRSDDGSARVTVSAQRHPDAVTAKLSVDGSPVATLAPVPADLTGPFTLVAQLQGRSVLVWHRTGGGTTYVGRLDLSPRLDLRAPAVSSTWSLGLTARGRTDLRVCCTRFEANLSGNGHADPRIVTYEDGTPVQDGTTVWFLATTRGGNIADAFQGVYALDTASGRITMTGALFGDRDGDGVWHNHNAGHLFLDRRTQRWTWFAVSHSDHPGPRANYVGSSSSDLRHGVGTVPVTRVAMPPGRALWEDVYPFLDGGTWTATASQDARHTSWLESPTGIAGPWTETRTKVGNDETGQLLVRSGGRRYVVAGTATTAFVVRDADDPAMPALGHLDVDVSTGGLRTWPALFALRQPDGPRWFMLSFDRTSPAERYSYGRLHFYRQA